MIKMMSWLGRCLLLIQFIHSNGYNTNQGKEFYLTLLEHIKNYSSAVLCILTDHPTGASVKISVPSRSDLQNPVDVTVASGITVKVSLSKQLLLYGNVVSDLGILVQSDQLISVQVFSQSSANVLPNSAGGYLAFPLLALGTQYMVVTYCETYSCIFGVVSTTNRTTLTIKLRLASGTVTFEGTSYTNGDTISVEMNQYQTLQLSSTNDLTGTKISSSNVVSVFVGADSTRVLIPTVGEDYVIEQLPPVFALGTDHFLLPMPMRKFGDLVRIVATVDNTEITTGGANYLLSTSGDYKDIIIASTELYYLNASEPILVAQLCKGYRNSDTLYSDPNLLIVTPVRQWRNIYTFTTTALVTTNNVYHLVLVAAEACIVDLKMDNSVMTTAWLPVSKTGFSSTNFIVARGYHNVSHNTDCTQIWGYIYGTAYKQSWVLPIGWGFRELVAESSYSQTSSTKYVYTADSVMSATDTIIPDTVTSVTDSIIADTITSVTDSILSTNDSVSSTSDARMSQTTTKIFTGSSTELISSADSVTSVTNSIIVDSVTPVTASIISTSDSVMSYNDTTISNSNVERFETSIITSSFTVAGGTSQGSSTETLSLSNTDESAVTSYTLKISTEFVTPVLLSEVMTTHTGVSEVMTTHTGVSEVMTTHTGVMNESSNNSNVTTVDSTNSHNGLCKCECRNSNSEAAGVVEKILSIQSYLLVDKRTVSATIRKKISIPDNRPSAVAIGYVGIISLVVVFSLAIVPDILRLLYFMKNINRQNDI